MTVCTYFLKILRRKNEICSKNAGVTKFIKMLRKVKSDAISN